MCPRKQKNKMVERKMKITKSQLKQIIKEELLKETDEWAPVEKLQPRSMGLERKPVNLDKDIKKMIDIYHEEDANDWMNGRLNSLMQAHAVYQVEEDPHLEYGGELGVYPDYDNVIDHILSTLDVNKDPRYREYERELAIENSALTQAVRAAADASVEELMTDGTYDEFVISYQHERSGV